MPARLVNKKFREGRLHSGSKHGPIVRDPRQARAIQISEARAEGHDIPSRPSKKSRQGRRGQRYTRRKRSMRSTRSKRSRGRR